jgi:hypothetical protein
VCRKEESLTQQTLQPLNFQLAELTAAVQEQVADYLTQQKLQPLLTNSSLSSQLLLRNR